MRSWFLVLVRGMHQLVLTLAALLGLVSVLLTLGAPILHVRPLIFLSGSMSPAVPTGSLGLARTTPAADLRVGDVVTVPASDHGYVTHRIVEITHHDDVATVQLKGDANLQADPTLHQVLEAPRLLFSVPRAGAVVAWFSRTPGVYVLAGYVVVAVGSLRRRREQLRRGANARRDDRDDDRDDDRRDDRDDRDGDGTGSSGRTGRATARPRVVRSRSPRPGRRRKVAAAALVVATIAIAAPAQAMFLDTVSVSGTSVTAVDGTAPVVTCGASAGQSITINWTSVPYATGYRLYSDAGGATTTDVSASTNSVTYINKAAGTFWVRAIYSSSTWLSPPSNSKNYESLGQGSCY